MGWLVAQCSIVLGPYVLLNTIGLKKFIVDLTTERGLHVYIMT